ncbi:MAG: tRNA (pseudouridine(54)-N(1))-methyltransferase TrmY [Methanomicrobiales archaeon]|jgi:tRNA (pseudouridine54-N1)-methyltransferase|nr:tRNA (pseudouridine(54)-N(1))-methyltransferase TrmY [Methanomicrobiales archaeon]
MVSFIVVSHTATCDPHFSLNDLCGGAGRVDLLARAIQASLCVSHGIRQDVVCYLVFCSDPRGRIIRFSGSDLRRFNPDERSTAALIKKALAIPAGSLFREASPGVSIRVGGLSELLAMEGEKRHVAILDEHGSDIRACDDLCCNLYVLSDHQNFSEQEMQVLAEYEPVYLSLGPTVLHADHAIVLLHNERDRWMHG